MNFSEWMQRRRGLVFAVPAGALAVLVILAAINFDSGSAGPRKPSRIKDAEALLAPRTASAEELARASGAIGDQTSVALASGAWIQVADETGRLAQQYSATKLEPLQGSQLAMTEPRAMMYMKDGRVLVLAARKGVAYAPRRALESGTLEEDVEVRLFKPLDGRAIDIDVDLPTVVVTAEQAQFNGVLGEVRCEKAVRVATDAGSFAGEGLTLVLDGDGDGLESLVVDRALEPIRVDRAARAMAEKRRAAREALARVAAARAPVASPAELRESRASRPRHADARERERHAEDQRVREERKPERLPRKAGGGGLIRVEAPVRMMLEVDERIGPMVVLQDGDRLSADVVGRFPALYANSVHDHAP